MYEEGSLPCSEMPDVFIKITPQCSLWILQGNILLNIVESLLTPQLEFDFPSRNVTEYLAVISCLDAFHVVQRNNLRLGVLQIAVNPAPSMFI